MTLLGFLKDFIWGGDRMAEGAKLYVWEWADGGWNSGFATSLEEAKTLAKWMGTPTSKGGMTVTLVPVNVRLSTTHGLGSAPSDGGATYRKSMRTEEYADGTWEGKVHRVIARLSQRDWYKANHDKTGKRYAKHRPYSVSTEVQTLVEILGMQDRRAAEKMAKEYMALYRQQGLDIDKTASEL